MGGRQFFRISFLKLVIIGVFISLIGCGGGGGESILQSDQPKQESNQLVNILIEPDETLFWFEEDNSTLDSTLVTMGTEESIVELIDKINKQVVNSFQINFHREILNLRNERNYVLNFSLKLEDEDECNREFYLKIYRTIRESGFLEVINKPLEIRNSSINIWDPQHKICNVTIEISPQEFMEFLENNIDANNFEVIFAKIKMNRRFLSDPVIGYTFIFVIDTHDVNTYFNLISNVSKSFYWYLNTSILMDYIANKIEDTKKWAGYVLLRMIKPLYTLSGAGVVIGLTEQVIETMNNPYSDSYVVIKKVTPNVLKNTIETFNKFGGKVLNTIDGMVYMVDKIKKEDLKAEDILIGGLVIAGLFVKESYKPVISTLVEVLKLEREKEGLAKKFVESAFAIATCESVPERLKYLNTLTQKIFTDIYSNIPQSDMCYLYKNRELPPVFTDKGYLYKEKNENFIIRHAFIKGTRSKIFALLFGIPYENENDDNECWHCVSYAHIFTRDLFGSCTAVNETDKENLKSNLESFALDFFGSIFGLAEALVNPKEPESGNLVVTPDQYTVNEITSDQFSINPIKSGTSPCINHKAVCIEFVSNLENKVKQIFFKERKLIKQKCNDISHPTINNPPEIKVFSANQTFGEAPLTVEFEWEVVDPDGDTLTCHLDANNDKIYEYTGSCDTTTPISYTYNSAGTYTAVLKVNDGQYESLKSLTINVEQPVEQSSPIFNFILTSNKYPETVDLDQACKNEFGPEWRLADWNDLKDFYNNGGDLVALLDYLGMKYYPDKLGGDSAWVSANGERFWSLSRHYFIARHDHETSFLCQYGGWPNGGCFLEHDHLDNHLISLGSWYGERPVLCYKEDEISLTAYKILDTSFEEFPTGSLPDGFTIIYDGKGANYQSVVDTIAFTGSKSFRVWGVLYWCSNIDYNFNVFDYKKVEVSWKMYATENNNGWITFVNKSGNTWGWGWCGVGFSPKQGTYRITYTDSIGNTVHEYVGPDKVPINANDWNDIKIILDTQTTYCEAYLNGYKFYEAALDINTGWAEFKYYFLDGTTKVYKRLWPNPSAYKEIHGIRLGDCPSENNTGADIPTYFDDLKIIGYK